MSLWPRGEMLTEEGLRNLEEGQRIRAAQATTPCGQRRVKKVVKLDKLVYKVVRKQKEGGQCIRLVSSFVGAYEGENCQLHRLVYSPEHITIPEGKSLIFAFADSDSAFRWAGNYSKYEVWKAKTSEIMLLETRFFPTSMKLIEKDFTSLWNDYVVGNITALKQHYPGVGLPSGTVLCPNLQLFKKMEYLLELEGISK